MGSEGERSVRRNVLVIVTDQERWFAEDPVPLPGRAWLRAHGTTFDRFYAASMACSPARSVIYTGRHVTDTGVLDNLGVPGQGSMRRDLPTLGSLLADHGYRCAYKGKWHLSDEATPAGAEGPLPDALLDYGFADYNAAGDDLGGAYEGHHRDSAIADDAVRWLHTEGTSASAAGTPWCLAVNLVNPHDIMWATIDQAAVDERRTRGAPGYLGPPETDLYAARWDLPDDPTWLQPLDPVTRPSAHLDFATAQQLWTGRPATNKDELRRFRDYYLNCLREVDVAITTVIDGLRRSGLADDTVIVFTSDHGELAGAHGLFGKGPCAYDANLRIPLVIVDPDRPGGRRTDALGSQVDLVPTVLALAGVLAGTGASAEMVGVDLGPALDRVDARPRREALFAYESLSVVDGDWALRTFVGFGAEDQMAGRDLGRRGFLRTLVTDHHTFTRYFAPGDHHRPRSFEELTARNTLELFDLDADPLQLHDLAAEPSDETKALVEHLDERLSWVIAEEIGEDDGRWMPAAPGAPWTR